ncbi:thioesterase II family protein [Mangrovihabitans endophyticus]|uniref:thioesterase II family protein n=1 Tax=Mangrovihabitans endophyticus TaxID=1751298 RepID=UPI003571006C
MKAPAPRSRLVCFPHAGGSASYYLPVARALGDIADVVAVQYPGRQDRRHEPFLPTLADVADQMLGVAGPLDDLPLVLFGHSMGASIAFEVAARLEAGGARPAALFASGRRAPSTHRVETVHKQDDAGLLAEVRDLNGTDTALLNSDPEFRQMVLPALRADYRAAETYEWVPGPALGCPIVALRGVDDPHADEAETLAWQQHTTGGFEMHSFTGGHFFVNDHVAEVIRLVRGRLSAAAHP